MVGSHLLLVVVLVVDDLASYYASTPYVQLYV